MGRHRVSCPGLAALALCATVNVFVGATSIIPFFSDSSCQDSIFTAKVDEQAFSGACQAPSQETNSVDPSQLDSCCAVTVYTGPYCSNDPTLAPNGTCTGLNIGSYSVDCPCLPSASPQSASSAASSTSSTSVSPASEPSPFTSSSASTAMAVSSSPASLSTEDRTPISATAPSTAQPHLPSSSSQSPSLSSSTSAASKGDDGNGGGNGLGVPAQIAIGVIIPSLSLIVAVIFGVRMWRRR